MNILIIVNRYPPDIKVAARRWGNLVTYLQQTGHSCTVISAGDGKPETYTGTAGEKVVRVSISNKEIIKGKSELAVKSKMSAKRRLKDFFLRIIPSLSFRAPYDHWKATLQNAPDVLEIARQSDFIISSYGPIGPFWAGRWLAQKTNKKWVADIRDAFESKGTGKFWLARKLDRYNEKQILKKAFLRITVGETLANYLSKQYKQKFIAIYNGWSNQDRLPSRISDNKNNPYFYYAGTIYQHRIHSLSVLLHALQEFPQLKLIIRLLKDSTGGELNALLERCNQSNQIIILPPAPPETIEEELIKSAGVVVIESLDSSDELRNGTVTGKLLGLLVSGIPGIAVVSKNCEITKLIQKANGWYSVDNVDDCIMAIKKVLEERKLVDNSEQLEDLHMKRQASKLVNELINSR